MKPTFRTIVISYVPPDSQGVLVDLLVTGTLQPNVAQTGSFNTKGTERASVEFMTHRLPTQVEFDSEYHGLVNQLSCFLLSNGVRVPLVRTIWAFVLVQVAIRWYDSKLRYTWGRLVASFNTTTSETRREP